MIIFIKKIKTKEGINSFDLEKIKKDIPADLRVSDDAPIISFTANHIVIAFKCQKNVVQAKPKKKAKTKSKAKRIVVARV
jgi:hypothetical protein